ncbi:chemotaxis protein CheB [Flavobacterium sp. 3HN19-14]|uniref:chemotaxis protein CheB n=1 Tax=Flavobacterium sp. 3HN19-14 TaxID=3448133 RepID=UPI003EDE834A
MEKSQITTATRVVIIGGSAGSLDVLMKILPRLQAIASYALVIVLHRKSAEDSTLEELFALKTSVPVREVEDKTPLRHGFIYVAPSDYHLLFEKNNLLSLDTSEKVNHSRPSIDVSFESAADVYGENLTGILLSGANSDGTNGLITLKESGGITIVQNPDTAEIDFMPRHAIDNAVIDYVLDVEGILSFLNSEQ